MSTVKFSFSAQEIAVGDEQTELIAYADRFGQNLSQLHSLLSQELDSIFDGVHILPFYTPFDGKDAGFDPVDHCQVDPRLGNWQDIHRISEEKSVMADLIVNHVSVESPAYQKVLTEGDECPEVGMFLTFSSVFPHGASEEDLATIYRPRPGLPFTHYTWGQGEKSKTRLVWTTFTPQQIDVNVKTSAGRAYLDSVLSALASGGVKKIRLDAVGYAIKTPGTTCFMTPETYQFIGKLADQARHLGMSVLVEIHSFYENQIQIAKKVDFVYDFALPPLLLHALHTGKIAPLLRWLEVRPLNTITVLDTHDGIGIVDIGKDSKTGKAGLVSDQELSDLVESIHEASNGASRQATGWAASNVDIYQVNCTFPDACGSIDAYLLARAVQVFTPGITQVYYAGLLAAPCDLELLKKTGVGRDINRPYYTLNQVRERLNHPTVQKQMELLKLRRTHLAFRGNCQITANPETSHLAIRWEKGTDWAQLDANFAQHSFQISHS